jgi:DNA processing protein
LSLVSGVGPRILTQLLDHFGSPENVLSAAPSELREIPGVGPKLARAISAATSEIDVAAELATCRDHGIQILTAEDEKYPRMLAQIIDPPGVLFLQGEITAADSVAVAIVGSRHATRYGVAQAERLAGGLARTGITVVGGLARGIDAAAHRAALAAGGRTIAVLGGGLLKIYPPEHQELAQQISRQGA